MWALITVNTSHILDFVNGHNTQTTPGFFLHWKERSPHLQTRSHCLHRAVLALVLFYLPSPDESAGLIQLVGHWFTDPIPSLFPRCVEPGEAALLHRTNWVLSPSAGSLQVVTQHLFSGIQDLLCPSEMLYSYLALCMFILERWLCWCHIYEVMPKNLARF